MPQENAVGKEVKIIGKHWVFYRRISNGLHYKGLIEPSEVEEIAKVQADVVIVYTDLNPMAIPHRLSLNKESIKKDGLLIHFSNVEERFWKG